MEEWNAFLFVSELINMEYKSFTLHTAHTHTLQTSNVQLNRFKFIGEKFLAFYQRIDRCKFNCEVKAVMHFGY